jgi:hypothetical protein
MGSRKSEVKPTTPPSKKASKLEEDLKQKYLSAPNEKLRKFYRDMLIKKGYAVPKL